MIYKLVIKVLLQTILVYSIPLQLQMLQQQPMILQQQLMGLQNLQDLQKYSAMNSPIGLNMQQPLQIVLLPNPPSNVNIATNDRVDESKPNDSSTKSQVQDESEDLNSVIIDSEPTEKPKRTVLLLPNDGRLSIGGIISAIPFLPIEINVPDTISWAYNGISGLISGIGQRLPLWRPTPVITDAQYPSLMAALKRVQMTKQSYANMPMLVVPFEPIVLPFQV